MSQPNLDEVLEEYATAAPAGNDLQILRLMTEEHPKFAEDLTDFAAARAVVRHAPEEELSAEEERRFQESGLKNLRAVLGSLNHVGATGNALQSLVETAKSKGLNRSSFASRLGLSVSLVQYLEKRRLDFASIPKTIVARLAEVLEIGEQVVSNYLNQPPSFAKNASFKASERPEQLQPKNFAEVVREDQTLSPEEKRKLLEL